MAIIYSPYDDNQYRIVDANEMERLSAQGWRKTTAEPKKNKADYFDPAQGYTGISVEGGYGKQAYADYLNGMDAATAAKNYNYFSPGGVVDMEKLKSFYTSPGGGSGMGGAPSGGSAPGGGMFPGSKSNGPMGAEQLSALYGGIDYDQGSIKGYFDAATKAQYDQLRKEYDATANKFYGQMYGTQNTALDTIRKSNAAAVATGASRGIQAANELSAILGLEATNGATATQLATDRNALADKEAAAYATNALNAMNTSNQLKLSLGSLGSNLYATDTQFDVGLMNYYAALNQASQALAGTKYASDANLAGTKYASDANANANIAAAQIQGQYSLKAAQAANAAQAEYYKYMTSQGAGGSTATDYEKSMTFIQNQYNKFMGENNPEAAAVWFGQMTGLSYNDALKKVKAGLKQTDLQQAAKGATSSMSTPYQYMYRGTPVYIPGK
jgi:hypothetical protein